MPIASSLLNKPRLVQKLRDFHSYVTKNDGKVGTKTRGIDLNFNNSILLIDKEVFPTTEFISTLYNISLNSFNSNLFLQFDLFLILFLL